MVSLDAHLGSVLTYLLLELMTTIEKSSFEPFTGANMYYIGIELPINSGAPNPSQLHLKIVCPAKRVLNLGSTLCHNLLDNLLVSCYKCMLALLVNCAFITSSVCCTSSNPSSLGYTQLHRLKIWSQMCIISLLRQFKANVSIPIFSQSVPLFAASCFGLFTSCKQSKAMCWWRGGAVLSL